ncbi:MAG: hypothetical protein ACK56I_22775, partial [bacterium]
FMHAPRAVVRGEAEVVFFPGLLGRQPVDGPPLAPGHVEHAPLRQPLGNRGVGAHVGGGEPLPQLPVAQPVPRDDVRTLDGGKRRRGIQGQCPLRGRLRSGRGSLELKA